MLDDVENNTGLGGLVTRAMLQRVLRIVLETDDDDDDADADAGTRTRMRMQRQTPASKENRRRSPSEHADARVRSFIVVAQEHRQVVRGGRLPRAP